MFKVLELLLSIGDNFIEDPDKKTEYAYKVMDAMLNTKTYPLVDALVKLAYASEQIVKGLFRPVGASLMFIFAAYCTVNGIVLPEIAEGICFGAPIGWGLSRYQEKKKGFNNPIDPF